MDTKTAKTIAQKLAIYFKNNLTSEAKGALGDRAEAMIYNAAMLVMDDRNKTPEAKNILRCYTDLDFVKGQLALVLDRKVYDYWVDDVPALMKSADAKKIVETFNDECRRIVKDAKVSLEVSLPEFVDVLYADGVQDLGMTDVDACVRKVYDELAKMPLEVEFTIGGLMNGYDLTTKDKFEVTKKVYELCKQNNIVLKNIAEGKDMGMPWVFPLIKL